MATLVEAYEKIHFPSEDPTPIEAIEFQMDQLGLKPKDLVPYVGSRSKVSEVLSGKRSLSLNMIRALSEALDIPADVLIRKAPKELPAEVDVNWKKFPIAEMEKRQWFANDNIDVRGLQWPRRRHHARLYGADRGY